ncbi:hypothetical protein DEU56DRAFT_930588 [Suillus clintonianus]|uniref:uncharacterized protein n=1 Tax=Suillus clintonianus TaxID=1904413 RepID=UPI001B87131E|nr:uncharacterized protein DEU56DRAFT_930588 [Suillus clintonianus]KAG2146625.1 hypothetical protein DEU56DRAFT_930588 [Suillus clintonianus]
MYAKSEGDNIEDGRMQTGHGWIVCMTSSSKGKWCRTGLQPDRLLQRFEPERRERWVGDPCKIVYNNSIDVKNEQQWQQGFSRDKRVQSNSGHPGHPHAQTESMTTPYLQRICRNSNRSKKSNTIVGDDLAAAPYGTISPYWTKSRIPSTGRCGPSHEVAESAHSSHHITSHRIVLSVHVLSASVRPHCSGFLRTLLYTTLRTRIQHFPTFLLPGFEFLCKAVSARLRIYLVPSSLYPITCSDTRYPTRFAYLVPYPFAYLVPSRHSLVSPHPHTSHLRIPRISTHSCISTSPRVHSRSVFSALLPSSLFPSLILEELLSELSPWVDYYSRTQQDRYAITIADFYDFSHTVRCT